MFQSTRPRGARLAGCAEIERYMRVSIHAPAWGATGQFPINFDQQREFQSTRPRGARPAVWRCYRFGCWFQSTRPRGARHSYNESLIVYRWFQSTRPRGARLKQLGQQYGILSFQSTRPRGARRSKRGEGCRKLSVSIHAPAWGATISTGRTADETMRFNPRARVGRDEF